MKQIINNTLYDTETAEFIIRYYLGFNNRELYRTKKNHYFCMVYDYFDKPSYIEEKEENFVKDLLGRLDTEKYIELFGEPEEA